MSPRNLFEIEVPPGTPVQPIFDASDLESVKVGQIVAPFNDYYLKWDEDCVAPSELEKWRTEGDPLSDDVVRELDLKPGQDGLQKIIDHLELPESSQSPHIRAFWAQIAREPPEGITAFPVEQPHTATPAITDCNRYPAPTVSQGQAVFWRYASQIFGALLHYSLAGGFSANRLIGVLRETNYLVGADRDRTYRRLLETTQAITDYMNDLTPVTGQGWKSAIRVRLLHSAVRVRLADSKGAFNTYDNSKDGVPINQEDMLATLGSFAIAPLWSLKRQDIHLTPEEEAAYIAVWRHVGYYLGVSPDRLRHYYSSVSRASKILACHTMHLFCFDTSTIDHRSTHTYRLLAAVAERPPRKQPIEHSLAVSRFLLGDGLADRLLLPKIPPKRKVRMKFGMGIEKSLVYFGRVYTHRWEIERVSLTRLLIRMIVCWQLGVKRTKFTPKPHFEDDEKEALGMEGDNDELDPDVVMGPVAGRTVIRRWRWLLAEMAAVVAVPTIMLGYGAYAIVSHLTR